MQPVERSEVEGVDYGWVMQTTFVLTILLGAPLVALLSTAVTLDSWGARAMFAVRVGAPVWFVTAVGVFLYARRTNAGDVVDAEDVAGEVSRDGATDDVGNAEDEGDIDTVEGVGDAEDEGDVDTVEDDGTVDSSQR